MLNRVVGAGPVVGVRLDHGVPVLVRGTDQVRAYDPGDGADRSVQGRAAPTRNAEASP